MTYRTRSILVAVMALSACGGDDGAPPPLVGSSDDGETGVVDGTTGTTSGLDSTSTTTGETSGTETGTTDGSEATGEPGSETSDGGTTDGPMVDFGPLGVFGDDAFEQDLVGEWGLNWEPEGGPDTQLTILGDGSFAWIETDEDCSVARSFAGALWMEGLQIIMHIDSWSGELPWDTESITGETYPPPFRLGLSFSLQGSPTDAYLSFAGPSTLTALSPYTGESYVQTEASGEHLGGVWRGEAQLIGAHNGEATVIVRDVYEAFTTAESDPDDPQGVGSASATTTYFDPPANNIAYSNFNWTCLDGCPDPAGVTYIAGANLYTYGPFSVYRTLMTFESGRAFRKDVESDCP